VRRHESRVALVTAEFWWSMEAQTLFPSSVVLATAVAQPAGLQYPWKSAVGLSGPGVSLIGAELSKARGLGSSAARLCGVWHASSAGGSPPPLVPKQHHRVVFFLFLFFLHTYALHQIRCTLGAVFTGCALWAAARYLGPSACPASHSMPPGRGHA